jgi:hypothetical protein
MANSYLLSDTRGTVATLIGDLSRSVEILAADIEHEEMRSGVRNVADPAYPMLARSLRARRENIGATIAILENLRAPTASALDTTEHPSAECLLVLKLDFRYSPLATIFRIAPR